METIIINCSECGKKILVSTEEAKIHLISNNDNPRLRVTVECPYCLCNRIVYETSINVHKLLDEIIKNCDFDSII